jgi:hypothetical protein
MSNSIVIDKNLVNTLENTKAWQSTCPKILNQSIVADVFVSAQHNATRETDFIYAVDRQSNALHLKIKTADGEVIREVVFKKIDINVMNTSILKGVLFDDRS